MTNGIQDEKIEHYIERVRVGDVHMHDVAEKMTLMLQSLTDTTNAVRKLRQAIEQGTKNHYASCTCPLCGAITMRKEDE
jgi:hypothetical protein